MVQQKLIAQDKCGTDVVLTLQQHVDLYSLCAPCVGKNPGLRQLLYSGCAGRGSATRLHVPFVLLRRVRKKGLGKYACNVVR